MPMLKLRKDNPRKELDFEVRYQLSLTKKQRLEIMWGDDAMTWLKFARKHERAKTSLIIKRT